MYIKREDDIFTIISFLNLTKNNHHLFYNLYRRNIHKSHKKNATKRHNLMECNDNRICIKWEWFKGSQLLFFGWKENYIKIHQSYRKMVGQRKSCPSVILTIMIKNNYKKLLTKNTLYTKNIIFYYYERYHCTITKKASIIMGG